MGEVVFNKIQYGMEATSGFTTPAAVAATNTWPGTIRVPNDRTVTYTQIPTGTRARAVRSQINQIHVDGWVLNMPTGFFQKLPALLQNMMVGAVAGSSLTGVQADYQWDGTPSLTATNALKSMTIEYGDNTQAYEINAAFGRRLTMSGTLGTGAPVTVEVEGFAQQITTTTFTASLTTSSGNLEPMIADMTKFYIDNTWSTSGCTIKTDILRDWTLDVRNGVHAKYTATGSKVYNQFGEGFIDATLTCVLEGNATADTEYDIFTSGSTPRAVRLEVIGSTIPGTLNTHKFTADLYGTWESVIPMSTEQDGNNLHAAIFHAYSNGSANNQIALKVVTNVNTV